MGPEEMFMGRVRSKILPINYDDISRRRIANRVWDLYRFTIACFSEVDGKRHVFGETALIGMPYFQKRTIQLMSTKIQSKYKPMVRYFGTCGCPMKKRILIHRRFARHPLSKLGRTKN
jgi:hypothetical protein